MTFRSDILELAAINLVLILFSLIGIVWDIWSRLLFNGIDGILLLLVCLMMGGIFSLQLLLDLKNAGMLHSIKFFHRKPAAAVAPASSAPSASPEGK
jgi:hypothetical protein